MATYAFHLSETDNFGWQLEDLPSLQWDDWLHIASLVTVMRPGSLALLDWANQLPCGLSYDINVRSDCDQRSRRVLGTCQPPGCPSWGYEAGSSGRDEDVKFLARAARAGAAEATDPLEVVARWVETYKINMAVVTLGAGGEEVRVPGFSTDVVDTIGAGDTFMPGCSTGTFIGARTSATLCIEERRPPRSFVLGRACNRRRPPKWIRC
jgi:fructokinase